VREGCLALGRSYRYFPSGSIHVAVVDPGVGTQRRGIAAQLGDHFFVCPDNGLLTLALDDAEKDGAEIHIVQLDRPRYWLPQVSSVFHGRDVFAPVAAHLANGIALDDIGSPITDPQRIDLPQPQQSQAGWQGQVIEVDRFGNLSTNLTRAHLTPYKHIRVRIAGREINGLAGTFGERPAGELVAVYGTEDDLMIAVVNGSAAAETGAQVGTPVDVIVGAA
jgi:S-adenosylmethionine hydrolase